MAPLALRLAVGRSRTTAARRAIFIRTQILYHDCSQFAKERKYPIAFWQSICSVLSRRLYALLIRIKDVILGQVIRVPSHPETVSVSCQEKLIRSGMFRECRVAYSSSQMPGQRARLAE